MTFDNGGSVFNPMVPPNIKLLPYHPVLHPVCRTDSFRQMPAPAVGHRSDLTARFPHPRSVAGRVGRSYACFCHDRDGHRDVTGSLIDIYA